MASLQLPEPSPDALAASRELVERIAAQIDAAGGWIGFDHYMRMALYEPRLGYYSGGSRKFGPAGDFVTGPELSPIYGACIATQCAAWFEELPAQILEFGAGTGALAAQVLNELARLGHANVRYSIVELSAELRERQLHTITMLAPEMVGHVHWLDGIPAYVNGVVLGNEVLDAMPVRAFRLWDGQLMERGVAVRDGRFEWADLPADGAFASTVAALLTQADWPHDEVVSRLLPGAGGPPPMALDYRSEVPQMAVAWVDTLMSRLGRAAVLLIDYGFPAREFYHPQRSGGTLMCHYRHRAHDDPFFHPGLQDITAHVDFSAIALAADRGGAAWCAYTSQARFLLNCGILDRLAKVPREDPVVYAPQAQAVQKLLSEAEMGELFKVLAFGVGCDPHPVGFALGDRSHTL